MKKVFSNLKITALICTTLLVHTPTIYAATPIISNVSGTIQTGQALIITGSHLIDINTSYWNSIHTTYPNHWSFEGPNHTADGWDVVSGNTAACSISYDSNVRLFGNQSIRFNQRGAYTGPSQGQCTVYEAPIGIANEWYFAAYVRFDASAGSNQWPDNYMKMLLEVGTGANEVYFQPAMNGGNPPNRWRMRDGVRDVFADNPSGTVQNNRWYHFEVHWKTTSPLRYEAWVDGTKIGDWVPTGNVISAYLEIGMPNLDATTSSFNMTEWWDGVVVSSNRIYPAAVVEIGNNANYPAATKVYQTPTYLSDGSISVVANLTGLGSGPYYLWVTNNRQERSASTLLTGGTGGPFPSVPPGALR